MPLSPSLSSPHRLSPAPMQTTTTAVLISLVTATSAFAQGFPEKPLRLVVPYPPGGNIDITARAISPGLAEILGQSVVVDNRSGAGGIFFRVSNWEI